MTSLVSRVLSQTEKLPVIGNASTWYSGKKEEVWSNPNSRRTSLEDSGCYNDLYRLTPPGSPRYSMAAPPPYEKVVEPENRGLTNRITTILKRASFSSAANTDVKEPVIAPTANIDKKEIEHAMTLINVATDMNHSGNQQMATDLYMMGIDKLMSALPCMCLVNLYITILNGKLFFFLLLIICSVSGL
jgi:hypothetical protein